MPRALKVTLIALLVVILLLAMPIVVLLVAPMTYAGLVERMVRSTAGLELEYAGMDVSLFPLDVSISGLELYNPDPAFPAPLLTAEHLEVTARIADYFSDQAPNWWQGRGRGMVVRLTEDAEGNSNWSFGEPEPSPQQQQTSGRWMEFSAIQIADLRVLRIAEQRYEYRVHRAHIEQMGDERLRVNLDGEYQDQPLEAVGVLALPSSEQAREVDFQADAFGGSIVVRGRVGHDGVIPGRAHFEANVDELAALGALVGQDLDFLDPLRVSGTLVAPQQGRWELQADGEVAGEPLKLESAVSLAPDRYEVTAFDARYGQSRLQGTGSLVQQPGTLDLSARAEVLQIDYAGGLWKLTAPLTVDGRVQVSEGGAVRGVNASAATRGIDATVDAVLPAAAGTPLSYDVQATVRELSALEVPEVEPRIYDNLLPVRADLLAQRDGDVWHLELRGAGVAGTELSGDVEVDTGASPVAVRGRLRSPEIDLNTIPTTALEGEQPEPDPDGESPEQSPGGLIPDDPLPWDLLAAAVVDVDAQIDALHFNRTTFRDVTAAVRLEEGELVVAPLRAALTKGGVRGEVRVRGIATPRRSALQSANASEEDSRSGERSYGGASQGGEIDAELYVMQLVPADLGQPDQGVVDGGETDLAVNIRARGRSLQELAASLDGELALEVQHATIRNDLFESVTSDVVMQTLTMINPFVKQDEQTDLDCAAIHLTADDGTLTSSNRMVIETSKVVIRAGGTVDLADETINFDFMPSPRQGLGLSLGGLAELVRIKGTLSNPEPVADPVGVLKSGAKIGAAIATGGISVLAQGLFARARNMGTACGRIFEERVDVPEEIAVPDA